MNDYPLTSEPYGLTINIKMPEGNLNPIGGEALVPVILDGIRDKIKALFGEVYADVQIQSETLFEWTCKHCGKQHLSRYKTSQPWCCKRARATWRESDKREVEREDHQTNHIALIP
jgi:hypothetical protein